VGVPAMVAANVAPHVSVLSAGEAHVSHPTQGLLDALTVLQHKGRCDGLAVAIVGDIRHSLPPKTSSPGTASMTRAARSAVLVTWFLSTNPRMPRLRADLATSISVRLRPKTSGAECTWKSMAPAMGLWVGGGGGKTRTCCASAGRLTNPTSTIAIHNSVETFLTICFPFVLMSS
jgi:hypothetical protein